MPTLGAVLVILVVAQLVNKLLGFNNIQNFTITRHWPLSGTRRIQSTSPHTIYLGFILIFTFHLRLGLPNDVFLSNFPTKNLYEFLISPSDWLFLATVSVSWNAAAEFFSRTELSDKVNRHETLHIRRMGAATACSVNQCKLNFDKNLLIRMGPQSRALMLR